jgi:hypothetical protein
MNPETYLFRIQTDPNTSPTATAFFGEKVTVGETTFKNDIARTVNWNLTDQDQSITLGNKTLTYAEVSAFVTAIAYQELEAAIAKEAAAALANEELNSQNNV